MRPGIHVVVAFHGQHYGWGSRARADGKARTPTQTLYFYPDQYTNLEVASFPSFPQWGRMMVEFTNYLAREGF